VSGGSKEGVTAEPMQMDTLDLGLLGMPTLRFILTEKEVALRYDLRGAVRSKKYTRENAVVADKLYTKILNTLFPS
jgi:hypothetical protein